MTYNDIQVIMTHNEIIMTCIKLKLTELYDDIKWSFNDLKFRSNDKDGSYNHTGLTNNDIS